MLKKKKICPLRFKNTQARLPSDTRGRSFQAPPQPHPGSTAGSAESKRNLSSAPPIKLRGGDYLGHRAPLFHCARVQQFA